MHINTLYIPGSDSIFVPCSEVILNALVIIPKTHWDNALST